MYHMGIMIKSGTSTPLSDLLAKVHVHPIIFHERYNRYKFPDGFDMENLPKPEEHQDFWLRVLHRKDYFSYSREEVENIFKDRIEFLVDYFKRYEKNQLTQSELNKPKPENYDGPYLPVAEEVKKILSLKLCFTWTPSDINKIQLVKKERFTSRHMDILLKNWERFQENYGIYDLRPLLGERCAIVYKDDENTSFLFYHLLSREMHKTFLIYMLQDLPNIDITQASINMRNICDSSGKFKDRLTSGLDLHLMDIIYERFAGSNNLYRHLSLFTGNISYTHCSIRDKNTYRFRDIPFFIPSWTRDEDLELLERVIKYYSVTDLKTMISTKTKVSWNFIFNKMKKYFQGAYYTRFCQLKDIIKHICYGKKKETREWSNGDMARMIEFIYSSDSTCRDDIDWKALEQMFPGFSVPWLKKRLSDIIGFRVPEKKRKYFEESLEFLYHKIRPVLLVKDKKRVTRMQRLDLLQEFEKRKKERQRKKEEQQEIWVEEEEEGRWQEEWEGGMNNLRSWITDYAADDDEEYDLFREAYGMDKNKHKNKDENKDNRNGQSSCRRRPKYKCSEKYRRTTAFGHEIPMWKIPMDRANFKPIHSQPENIVAEWDQDSVMEQNDSDSVMELNDSMEEFDFSDEYDSELGNSFEMEDDSDDSLELVFDSSTPLRPSLRARSSSSSSSSIDASATPASAPGPRPSCSSQSATVPKSRKARYVVHAISSSEDESSVEEEAGAGPGTSRFLDFMSTRSVETPLESPHSNSPTGWLQSLDGSALALPDIVGDDRVDVQTKKRKRREVRGSMAEIECKEKEEDVKVIREGKANVEVEVVDLIEEEEQRVTKKEIQDKYENNFGRGKETETDKMKRRREEEKESDHEESKELKKKKTKKMKEEEEREVEGRKKKKKKKEDREKEDEERREERIIEGEERINESERTKKAKRTRERKERENEDQSQQRLKEEEEKPKKKKKKRRETESQDEERNEERMYRAEEGMNEGERKKKAKITRERKESENEERRQERMEEEEKKRKKKKKRKRETDSEDDKLKREREIEVEEEKRKKKKRKRRETDSEDKKLKRVRENGEEVQSKDGIMKEIEKEDKEKRKKKDRMSRKSESEYENREKAKKVKKERG